MRRTQLNSAERFEAGRIIQEKTGYYIKNRSILNQVFTRSSLAAEMGKISNEILEFTGDSVLGFYVVKIVSGRCGSCSDGGYRFRIRANKFTLIKQVLVNNESLAKIIDEWDLVKYLLLGKSDIQNDVANETKVKADLFEAIIGAIAIDSGWNAEILENAVRKALDIESRIDALIETDTMSRLFDIDNAITTLKEIAENGQCTMPIYEFVDLERSGCCRNGDLKWECKCKIINEKRGIVRYVRAASKKEAKKAAAYLVLCEHWNMQNKYGENSRCMTWSYRDEKLIPDKMV